MQSANGPDPLANLAGIHAPADVSAWPLAWGWWVLIAITTLFLGYLIVKLYRQYQFNRARRQALVQVMQITATEPDWPSRLNTLLKRTALTYFDTRSVASLYGPQWLAFLTATLPPRFRQRVDTGLNRLTALQYQSGTQPADFDTCHSACVLWLKHAKLNAQPADIQSGSEAEHV
ncbi:DUF4381 domain-containing protein [Alteromonas halophila]|uniref:DUF4381 domain-containing protein n=1 Tax=Alteromonas halophila TaxID=516698 RepID=A0A918JG82_9ALTE|nr:DUF4381 domain-containing protein [Alteromonas halophila]GGW74514.1 hypothetical protein GCM10007391_03110 [Alteromonas halophila]